MYYLFVASKAVKMESLEEFLNSVIVDEFYFEAWSDKHGYIETALPISDVLLSQINVMNEDLGIALSFLSTPKLDELSIYLANTLLANKTCGYLSLADACLLSLFKQDTFVKEKLFAYFDEVDRETMSTVISFVRHGGNVLATSKDLYLHRNTMNYRLSRFSEATGLDIRNHEHVQLIYVYALVKENGNLF